MEFLFQNPLILVSLVLVVMIGLAYIIVKPRKKKNTKQENEKPKSENITETTGEPQTSDGTPVSASEDNSNQQKKKKKLKKLKPEITKVYEKKKLKSKEEKKPEELSPIEEEFLKKMQFVKTSKNISRLKPYIQEEVIEENNIDELTVPPIEESVVQEKKSRFDRTRRLSKMIKEGTLDDMFCSHISEKYMNMDDISRHIRNCDEIEQKLFDRAAKTMANSESKIAISEEGKIQTLSDKDSMKAWLEERRREELAKFVAANNENVGLDNGYEYEDIVQDDVDLSARNVLVVDSILNRKGKSKSKK